MHGEEGSPLFFNEGIDCLANECSVHLTARYNDEGLFGKYARALEYLLDGDKTLAFPWHMLQCIQGLGTYRALHSSFCQWQKINDDPKKKCSEVNSGVRWKWDMKY